MATKVINTVSLTKNPEFKNVKTINKNFRKIKKEHCNSLLDFLYNDGLGKWQNPFTKKFLRRESPIIISFLSRCYYMDDDSKINIQGCNLTYKKHIEKFINKEYLYVPSKKKSTNIKKSNINTQSVHGDGSRRSSCNKSTINAGSPFQFNTIGTWQPNLIQQPFAQSFVQSFKQPFAQSRVQSFEQPLSQPSYTYQQPYQQPQYTHTPAYQLPYHSTYQPFQQSIQQPQKLPSVSTSTFTNTNLPLSSKDLPTKDNLIESVGLKYKDGRTEKIFQHYIPDHIWKRLKTLRGNKGYAMKTEERKEIFEKWNKKYIEHNAKLARWASERPTNPDKVRREEEAYDKKEQDKKNYWIKKKWQENYVDKEMTKPKRQHAFESNSVPYTTERNHQEIRSIGEIPGYLQALQYWNEINQEKNRD